MDDNKDTLIIALAGFMHDIGKFIQRIQKDSGCDKLPDNPVYQPESSSGFSHIHTVYTAFFIQDILKDIPEIKDRQKLINLAARHHIESNDRYDEYFILAADRISAGTDRKNYDENATEIAYSDWTKTRLVSIFDELDGKVKSYDQRRYEYGIAYLDEYSVMPSEKAALTSNYSTIAEDFYRDLEKLPKDSLKNWFIEFDKLNKQYTSFVPSATVEKVIPDISLYDHARTTSAIAQALYVYHKTNNDFVKENIKNKTDKKFIYLKIKFNGIQNFIFSQGGETNKNAAKLLRGRSFYISLIMKKICSMLCDETGLAHTAVIMNAAGAVTALLPNTDLIKNKIEEIKTKINNWLIEKFYGEVSVSFACIEISAEELKKDIPEIGTEIAKKLEVAKYEKIPLDKLGVIDKYFKENEISCRYCGKRPAKNDEVKKCDICEDLTKIGEILAKSHKTEITLKIPIFDIYDKVSKNDYDNLYVPKIKTDDGYEQTKDFEKIIESAEAGNTGCGIKALGVLKADIDNLGALFKQVSEIGGISRFVTFSRMLDAFWTIWLPEKLKKDYPDIYTVFSGGDDLFLIGHWQNIIDFAAELKTEFKKFTCNSPQLTFSAGIVMLKPGEPVKNFYTLSENALEQSKLNKDKNSLTLFNSTVSWNNQKDIAENDLFIDAGKYIFFNNSFAYKLLNFIDMADKEETISIKINLSLKDMQNFKWRSLLSYYISKNRHIPEKEKQQAITNTLFTKISEKQKRNALKISICKNIYKNR